MEEFLKNRTFTKGLIISSIVIVFLVDCVLPTGIIVWIFYLVPIGFASIYLTRRVSFLIIGICAVLLFFVVLLAPSGRATLLEYAIFNRFCGVVAFLIVHSLIVALQKTHKQIRDINIRFETAVKISNSGMWDFDIKNNINVWDDNMLRLYNFDSHTISTPYDFLSNLLDPRDSERATQAFKDALEGTSDHYDDSFPIIGGDGKKRFIRSYCRIERSNDGKPIKAIGMNIDITQQKIIEDDLQKLNFELIRSNKELENFAYIASHDLQEPLRMISSFSQLLEKKYSDKLDQEAHEFIKFVVDGANHMQHLINDLLAFSRITTQVVECKAIDSNTPAKRAIDNLQMKIESCNAVITIGDLPVICGDELQLERLFQNLIDNALKFSVNGNPTVEISCKPDFNAWLFAVKDNGIGIVKKNQDKIFEIFQRLNPRDKYPGTGIGLAICKRIVDQNGGKIWLESEPGEGTTFFFTIKK